MLFIFDLDGTVIDSSHRRASHPDGTIDLDHWIENCTPEKIARDSLLPLADTWRRVFPDATVAVCTARVMGEADHAFLLDHGLLADRILSRPANNRLPDPMLKEYLLRGFATDSGKTWARFCDDAIMYDDSLPVISHLRQQGLTVYNAHPINSRIAANG